MFAVAIFLSCALQYYIPLEILGPWARNKFSQTKHVISDGVLRVALVLITCEYRFTKSKFSSLKFISFFNSKIFYSRSSNYSSKIGSNNFINWRFWLIITGLDFPTRLRNINVWHRWNGSTLLEIMEKHRYHMPWHFKYGFRNVCKFFGAYEVRHLIR